MCIRDRDCSIDASAPVQLHAGTAPRPSVLAGTPPAAIVILANTARVELCLASNATAPQFTGTLEVVLAGGNRVQMLTRSGESCFWHDAPSAPALHLFGFYAGDTLRIERVCV